MERGVNAAYVARPRAPAPQPAAALLCTAPGGAPAAAVGRRARPAGRLSPQGCGAGGQVTQCVCRGAGQRVTSARSTLRACPRLLAAQAPQTSRAAPVHKCAPPFLPRRPPTWVDDGVSHAAAGVARCGAGRGGRVSQWHRPAGTAGRSCLCMPSPLPCTHLATRYSSAIRFQSRLHRKGRAQQRWARSASHIFRGSEVLVGRVGRMGRGGGSIPRKITAQPRKFASHVCGGAVCARDAVQRVVGPRDAHGGHKHHLVNPMPPGQVHLQPLALPKVCFYGGGGGEGKAGCPQAWRRGAWDRADGPAAASARLRLPSLHPGSAHLPEDCITAPVRPPLPACLTSPPSLAGHPPQSRRPAGRWGWPAVAPWALRSSGCAAWRGRGGALGCCCPAAAAAAAAAASCPGRRAGVLGSA